MNHLYILADGSLKQVEGLRPTDEDLQEVVAQEISIIRFRGNTFEKAVVEVEETEEEPISKEFTLEWERI